MSRPPPSSSGGPPVSFKTVPGRHRTQKWNTARTYDYSGGDWGGYDPYDDYGADYDDQPAPPPMPSQSQGYNPPPPAPGYGGYPRPARQSSFDEGDERRAFSGPGAFPPTGGRAPSGSPARSAASGGRKSGDYPRPSTGGRPGTGNRDFTNPEQVPPPLNPSMRGSPAPGLIGPGMVPPPRKSSVTADAAPAGLTGPPLPPPEEKKDEKELPTIPFIRPSDIYKRMEAERERERKSSMESSGRPNLADLDGSSATRSSSGQRPLSSVQEGDGEASLLISPATIAGSSGADPAADILAERSHDVHVNDVGKPGTLPHLDRTDPAASILAERTHDIPVSDVGQPGTLSHQPSSGYRSMVSQAFDTSSASRTHTMASSETTDVSRSNTTSTSNTSGISPIIPRPAPFEQPVSTIAEEPGRPSGESAQVTPGYRRSLDPPSHDNSPARTPGLEDASRERSLSGGYAAETITAVGATTDYSAREADLAREVDSSPVKAGTFEPEVAQREREVQDQFLEHHSPPTDNAFEAPRSSSPSKSRVRQLADQYQERDDAGRRNSVASTGGLSYKSSWSNFHGSEENLPATITAASASSNIPQRHATDASNVVSESDYGGVEEGGIRDSPRIEDAERPGFGREESFRPQLPGQWVSTTNILALPVEDETSAPTSTSRGLDEPRVSAAQDRTPRASHEQEPIDLTPTTTKYPLASSKSTDPNSPSMLAQAQTAGSALGAALLASVGQGHQTRDFASSSSPAKEVEIPSSRNPTGELGYLQRPELGRENTEASTASTVTTASSDDLHSSWNAPTTLPKDMSRDGGEIPSAGSEASSFFASAAVAPLRMNSPPGSSAGRVTPTPASYGPNTSGLERDDSTLRREIERSLDFNDDVSRTQDALDGPDNLARVENGQNALVAHEITDEKPLPRMPMMLDQRFSWEVPEKQGGLMGASAKETPTTPGVGSSAKASAPVPIAQPTPTIPRVQEPEHVPEILPEMPYERPRSRGLHIMNADNSDSEDDKDDTTSKPTQLRDSVAAERGLETGLPIGAVGAGAAVAGVAAVGAGAIALSPSDRFGSGDGLSTEGSGIVSPITKSQENLAMGSLGDLSVPSPPPDDGLQVREPQPLHDDSYGSAPEVVESTSSLNREVNTENILPPPPPEKEASPQIQQISPTTPTTPSAKAGKIPPFREILALKTPAARIQTYDSTRETFASMNTGLSDWLAAMVEQNPEYGTLASNPQAPLSTSGTWKAGHKASPSLAKLGSKLPFGGDSSGGTPQRSGTVAGASSSGTAGDGEGIAQLQQKGKDLMKGAGVLGGKAQAGAKGLLAKGRSRFGTQRESKGGGLGGKQV